MAIPGQTGAVWSLNGGEGGKSLASAAADALRCPGIILRRLALGRGLEGDRRVGRRADRMQQRPQSEAAAGFALGREVDRYVLACALDRGLVERGDLRGVEIMLQQF